MKQQHCEFAEFNEAGLRDQFGSGCSTEYLHGYLRYLNAGSFLIEHDYVDRHYLDEFSGYYSRSFDVPEAHCRRIHYFSRLSRENLEQTFASATSEETNERKTAQARLQDEYLGFVVRRPLAGAPMGRTVLKTYPVEGRRHYEAKRPYKAHVAGVSFAIEGLAFQHQDGGVAVCAPTALWSALQRVALTSGHRTPTPFAITTAARSPFPASDGLSEAAMAEALNNLGYVADLFRPAENRNWFRAQVVACLRSHLPVVLLMMKGTATSAGEVCAGHAITLTGFSEPERVVDVPYPDPACAPLPMRSGSLRIVYAHDDNLGPHAHYELLDSNERDHEGYEKLTLRRGGDHTDMPADWVVDDWDVLAALVPKPDKLRLSISSLLAHLSKFREVLGPSLRPFSLEFNGRISTGVQIKQELTLSRGEPKARATLLFGTSLPRHVGVLTASDDSTHLCDVLVDVTEVDRVLGEPSVLAILAPEVPDASPIAIRLQDVADQFEVPFVPGRV